MDALLPGLADALPRLSLPDAPALPASIIEAR